MEYRSDLDGLRAIAILFVLFYHGGLSLFPSGFIGVDVFFVISGFLITTIIHQSLNNNNFSFIQFYNRRLWRLQPVFIALIIFTIVLTLFFYLPDDLLQFSRSARKTSLFISNKFFEKTTTGYFSPDSNQLPLLHTWSLSIEWQCYLILPIIIYFLYRIFGKNYFNKIIYLITSFCFILSLYFSANHPTITYYLFVSRIFEFLMGSCIAVGTNRFLLNKYLLNFISILALISLVYLAIQHDIKPGFPNWYAFIVCISTAILIALGRHNPKPIVTHFLSTKPLVFIGLLSYSLYIWHWPLFALMRYQSVEETTSVLLLMFCLVFIVAYLSWRFIEKPARQFNKIKFSSTIVCLLLLPIIMTHTNDYLIKKNTGFPQRFNAELVQIYEQLNLYNRVERRSCIGDKQIQNCFIGSKNATSKKGFMIGDSFSNHYWGFMDILGQKANVSILAQAKSSCLTLPGIYLYNWPGFHNQVFQECYDQTAHYFNMIQANHYDYVIIGQVWINYIVGDYIINQLNDKRSYALTKKRISIALDKALKIITSTGAKPVLIKATAITTSNLHDCFFKPIKLRKKFDPDQCNFNLLLSQDEQWLDNLFNKMKDKYSQLIIIDPKDVQCPKGVCKANINGIPVYRDEGHITDYASYQLGELYLKAFKNPLLG